MRMQCCKKEIDNVVGTNIHIIACGLAMAKQDEHDKLPNNLDENKPRVCRKTTT